MIPEYLTVSTGSLYEKWDPPFLSTWPDKGMILPAGKIPLAKGLQHMSKTGRPKAPQAKELASDASQLILKGAKQQMAGRALGKKGNPKLWKVPGSVSQMYTQAAFWARGCHTFPPAP